MDICLPIRDIYVRKILDSGGSPAVEAGKYLQEKILLELHQLQDKKGEQEIEAGIEQMHSQIAEELIGRICSSRKRSTIYSKKEKEIPQEVSLAVSIATAKGSGRKAEAFSLPVFRWDSCTETSGSADPGGRRNCRRDRNGFQGTDACRKEFLLYRDRSGRQVRSTVCSGRL